MSMNEVTSDGVIYSSDLLLTQNAWLEQVTTDIPFLTIGIVAIAAGTTLLLTQRLSIPAGCILISAFIAFNGAILDYARLLQVVNPAPDSGSTAIVVLREVCLAISISLNYLFFLLYLGRPPRGEFALNDRARARQQSPSAWAYWGIFGYITQAILFGGTIAVAVLEVIWRVSSRPPSGVYMADGILQGILAAAFLGKTFLNAYLSPLRPKWKTFRNYLPIILALSLRLGIVLASEFCTGFTEAPLGRFLQAVQLYILIVFLLVSPYYGQNKQETLEPIDTKRASSFRGLRLSIIDPLSARLDTMEEKPQRPSPSQRLSSWLTNRLVAKRDPQQDRLWVKDQTDLEAPTTPGGKSIDEDPSPSQGRFLEKPLTATWQDPYLSNPNVPSFEFNDIPPPTNAPPALPQTQTGRRRSQTVNTQTSPRRASILSDSKDSAIYVARFEVDKTYESDSDSPVYGINGIVQRKAKREFDQRKRRSILRGETEEEAFDRLQKERDMLDQSVASMAAFSPSKPDFNGGASSRNLRPSDPPVPGTLSISNGGILSESLRSDFSINDFPSPPGSLSNQSTRETTPPNTTAGADDTLSQTKPSPNINQSQPPMGTEVVEDVQFAMVRPRIPASYQRRRASFPSVVRDSAASSNDGMVRIISAYAESEDDLGGKRVRMSSANNRLDVTSFIGELTTPQVAVGFPSRGDIFQGRKDSIDYRGLSPLPEDTTPRQSAEIIDMRLRTPSIVPAIAISTSETASVETSRTRKVSFAPASYEPVSRPKLRIPPSSPANTLPSSPRPGGGSPSASPKPFGNFKPATSSPLTKTSFGPNGAVPNATVPLRRAGSARANFSGGSSRPIITGPFPLRGAEAVENDYTIPRKAPAVRTQRFL
ncbi:hypothetical protein CPB86DRAFT_720926 [Serendipita vermifera]|nr:hypothetical protein CPB86DRAFT_720926 [Serendipita vermifera]